MLSGGLDTEWISDHLQASRVGRRIVRLDTTISTNEEAWSRSEAADADGLVVFAEEQPVGRALPAFAASDNRVGQSQTYPALATNFSWWCREVIPPHSPSRL